ELALVDLERLACEQAGRTADRLGDQAEGGARAERVASAHQDLDLAAAGAEALEQLVAEARLAGAGRTGHEHRARDPEARALVVEGLELGQVIVAPDHRRLAAEQARAGATAERALSDDHLRALAAVDRPGAGEQARRGRVDPHRARA